MADIKARERHEVEFTLECSGNTSADFFIGGIGNARWAGARLAPLLESADILDEGREVVFWGADSGQETIRDNTGILNGGQSGSVQPDTTQGLDLTITEYFARSMSIRDAMNRDNLLCYEMNGGPLPPEHGFPVRLIAPGWFGVANVKWLNRIEVMDHRYAGKFMARDYVSIREERRDDQTVWTFTTVSRERLEVGSGQGHASCRIGIPSWAQPGARRSHESRSRSITEPGCRRPSIRSSWKGPIAYAWRLWTFNWGTPGPGEHQIRSRAFDVDGNMQATPTDAVITNRRTFWESSGHITRRVVIPAAA